MIKRVSTLVMMLVVLITSQCYATQPRIANIGAEMFRQKFMENNQNYVSEFRPQEEVQVFAIPKYYPNSTAYVFFTSKERDMVVLYSNPEGYLESVVVVGYATSTTKNIQLTADAMKAAMALGLDNDEIEWLFTKGSDLGNMYTGVVSCKTTYKDIYLFKTIEPGGMKTFIFDYKPATERFK